MQCVIDEIEGNATRKENYLERKCLQKIIRNKIYIKFNKVNKASLRFYLYNIISLFGFIR